MKQLFVHVYTLTYDQPWFLKILNTQIVGRKKSSGTGPHGASLRGSMFDLQTHAQSVHAALIEAQSYLAWSRIEEAEPVVGDASASSSVGFGEREGRLVAMSDFATTTRTQPHS
jgi:hypothetical protein